MGPLLLSRRYAADHHREEQLGEEDRGHPVRRRGEGRRHLQGAVLHLERRRRRADDRRPQGPRDGRRLPRGLFELAGDRPPRPDRRRAGPRADRQERRQGRPQARQGGGLGRDRHRLRPRGRADRARGAAAGARGEPRAVAGGEHRRAPADQARPLLGADQGRDRARLLRARRALLRPRLRRLRAPGHRPDLGRDADPRGLARHPPLRLQLPLGRPRPEPDPGADRRARARAPRPRPEALLGAVREVRPSRRLVRGPPRDRQVLGARPRPTRRSPGPRAPASSRR